MPTEPHQIPPAAIGVEEAAAYTGLSRRTLYRLSAEIGTGPSRLPVVRIKNRRLFLIKDLDALLAQHRESA